VKFSTEIGWQVPVIQMHAGDLFFSLEKQQSVCVVDEFARIWEVGSYQIREKTHETTQHR
jgi:hypothetical protein